MKTESHIEVWDRFEPDELLDEFLDRACEAVGQRDVDKRRVDTGEVQMLHTPRFLTAIGSEQISMLFAADKSPLPGTPRHTVLVITYRGLGCQAALRRHQNLVDALGAWLNSLGVRWYFELDSQVSIPGENQ